MMMQIRGSSWEMQFLHGTAFRPDGAARICQCILTREDGKVLAETAFCHPKDQYSKKIGRKVAFWRAIKELPRDIRREFWAEYFRLMPGDKQ